MCDIHAELKEKYYTVLNKILEMSGFIFDRIGKFSNRELVLMEEGSIEINRWNKSCVWAHEHYEIEEAIFEEYFDIFPFASLYKVNILTKPGYKKYRHLFDDYRIYKKIIVDGSGSKRISCRSNPQ